MKERKRKRGAQASPPTLCLCLPVFSTYLSPLSQAALSHGRSLAFGETSWAFRRTARQTRRRDTTTSVCSLVRSKITRSTPLRGCTCVLAHPSLLVCLCLSLSLSYLSSHRDRVKFTITSQTENEKRTVFAEHTHTERERERERIDVCASMKARCLCID